MMKSRRSTRGLSPIFATLILIAIAVIAGIVVYMFTSGFLATGPTAPGTSEKVAIQGVDQAGGLVYAQCTAGGPVTLTNALIRDSQGNIVDEVAVTGSLTVGGGLTPITVDLSGITASGTYTVTLISQAGGSFVSPSFQVTAGP